MTQKNLFSVRNPKRRTAKKKATPAQIRARKEFARRVRAGDFSRKRKTAKRNPKSAKPAYVVYYRVIGDWGRERVRRFHDWKEAKRFYLGEVREMIEHNAQWDTMRGRSLMQTAINRTESYPRTSQSSKMGDDETRLEVLSHAHPTKKNPRKKASRVSLAQYEKRMLKEYRLHDRTLTQTALADWLHNMYSVPMTDARRIAKQFLNRYRGKARLTARERQEVKTIYRTAGKRAKRKKAARRKATTRRKNPTTQKAFGRRSLVIRATYPTKTGFKYYYLRGNGFITDARKADKFNRTSGEAKMHAIENQLPPSVSSITMVTP